MENEILAGDCAEVLRTIPEESIDLVLTDPPYNTGMHARAGTRLRHFFDDRLAPDAYRALAKAVSQELYRVLKNDRAAYIFMGWKSLGVWLDALSAASFRLKNVIVWDKVVHGLNWQDYAYTHEFLIFAVKGRFRPRNKGRGDDSFTDVWHIRREMRAASARTPHHETAKPYEVVRRPIEHASEPGELVLDPFAGSGTTCVVAKILGRRFIGIEREAAYRSIAAKRLDSVEPHRCVNRKKKRPARRPRRNAWCDRR